MKMHQIAAAVLAIWATSAIGWGTSVQLSVQVSPNGLGTGGTYQVFETITNPPATGTLGIYGTEISVSTSGGTIIAADSGAPGTAPSTTLLGPALPPTTDPNQNGQQPAPIVLLNPGEVLSGSAVASPSGIVNLLTATNGLPKVSNGLTLNDGVTKTDAGFILLPHVIGSGIGADKAFTIGAAQDLAVMFNSTNGHTDIITGFGLPGHGNGLAGDASITFGDPALVASGTYSVVPEPGCLGALALAAIVLCRRRA